MAKNTGSVCKLCRREGVKLFLKGNRCYTEKCSFDRRAYAPGQHGKSRKKVSQYAVQLREKQRLRRIYGINEKQFKRYFGMAEKRKGITGENLINILETRLDNVVSRLGFALSRMHARQLISHGHFQINGRKMSAPSYLVKVGDVIKLKEKSRQVADIQVALNFAKQKKVLSWLNLDSENFKGEVTSLPSREDVDLPVREELIVEFYSR